MDGWAVSTSKTTTPNLHPRKKIGTTDLPKGARTTGLPAMVPPEQGAAVAKSAPSAWPGDTTRHPDVYVSLTTTKGHPSPHYSLCLEVLASYQGH